MRVQTVNCLPNPGHEKIWVAPMRQMGVCAKRGVHRSIFGSKCLSYLSRYPSAPPLRALVNWPLQDLAPSNQLGLPLTLASPLCR